MVLSGGKASIALDLKQAADQAIVRRLIESADVVIENFRPGVMQRLGLGPDEMTEANPRLVYLSLPGFSSEDPERAQIPAWEGIIGAAVGQFTDMGLNRVLMGIDPSYSPLPLASSYAAVFGALAVVLALYARVGDGLGDVIEVPIAAAVLEGLAYNSMRIDPLPPRLLNGHALLPGGDDVSATEPRVCGPFDSTRAGLVPRGKVPGLGDRRQGVSGVDIKAGF